MAFQTPTSNRAPAANQTGTPAAREPRTTLAYVNAYLPLADGSRIKLFSDLTLRLFKEREAESKLIDLIKSGQYTEEQIAKLIKIEITLARDPDAEITFDLSGI